MVFQMKTGFCHGTHLLDCVPNFAYSIARFSRFDYIHFVKISAQNDRERL